MLVGFRNMSSDGAEWSELIFAGSLAGKTLQLGAGEAGTGGPIWLL